MKLTFYCGTGLLAGAVLMASMAPAADNYPSKPAAMPFIKSGRLKPLAISSPERHALLPAVPTFQESGVRDFVSFQWYGVFAPAGTPRETVALLNREINKALNSLDIRERFVAVTFDPTPGKPEAFLKLLQDEDARWRGVQKQVNVRLD